MHSGTASGETPKGSWQVKPISSVLPRLNGPSHPPFRISSK
jgi:hypothetical protein